MSDEARQKREQALRGRGFLDATVGREPRSDDPVYRQAYRRGQEATRRGKKKERSPDA